MSIQEKLLKVQSDLKAPKSQYNKFGGYNYRSCEDILEAVKPLCLAVGAVILVGDEVKEIGGRFYIEATARFMDIETGEVIPNTAYAREEENKKGMDGSQITGSASSYARKYALNGLLCIDDTKDADTTDNTSNGATKPAGNKASSNQKAGTTKPTQQTAQQNTQSAPQQSTQSQQQSQQTPSDDPNAKIDAIKITTINATLHKKGISAASMLGFYKVKNPEELTISQFMDAMNKLTPMPDKN